MPPLFIPISLDLELYSPRTFVLSAMAGTIWLATSLLFDFYLLGTSTSAETSENSVQALRDLPEHNEFNLFDGMQWLASLVEKDGREEKSARFPEGSSMKLNWAILFPFRSYSDSASRIQFSVATVLPYPEFMTFENRPKRSHRERDWRSRKADQIRQAKEDRILIYSKLENYLQLLGVNGRQCLLRTICEVADVPFEESLLGEVLNTLLSASIVDVLPEDDEEDEIVKEYVEAEKQGRTKGNCDMQYRECQSSVFEIIPNLEHRILD